jgi:biotin synthase
VKALGLETCVTLGMLKAEQAVALKDAGLDYYNHNLDTSPEYYEQVVTTRTYRGPAGYAAARAGRGHEDLLRRHRRHGREPPRPGQLPASAGHPAGPSRQPAGQRPGADRRHAAGRQDQAATGRSIRSSSSARSPWPGWSARQIDGPPVRRPRRHEPRAQALCFLAGANSIFIGGKLLTTPLPGQDEDSVLLKDLGMKPMAMGASA